MRCIVAIAYVEHAVRFKRTDLGHWHLPLVVEARCRPESAQVGNSLVGTQPGGRTVTLGQAQHGCTVT